MVPWILPKKNSIWASLATMERTGTGAGGGYQLLDQVVDLAKGILPTQIALGDVFKTNPSNDIKNQVNWLKSGYKIKETNTTYGYSWLYFGPTFLASPFFIHKKLSMQYFHRNMVRTKTWQTKYPLKLGLPSNSKQLVASPPKILSLKAHRRKKYPIPNPSERSIWDARYVIQKDPPLRSPRLQVAEIPPRTWEVYPPEVQTANGDPCKSDLTLPNRKGYNIIFQNHHHFSGASCYVELPGGVTEHVPPIPNPVPPRLKSMMISNNNCPSGDICHICTLEVQVDHYKE